MTFVRISPAVAGLGLAGRAQALEVIDPTGAIYTNISASSTFSSGFSSTNLFSQNMSSIAVHSISSPFAAELESSNDSELKFIHDSKFPPAKNACLLIYINV